VNCPGVEPEALAPLCLYNTGFPTRFGAKGASRKAACRRRTP
jgi:hypothetical protein